MTELFSSMIFWVEILTVSLQILMDQIPSILRTHYFSSASHIHFIRKPTVSILLILTLQNPIMLMQPRRRIKNIIQNIVLIVFLCSLIGYTLCTFCAFGSNLSKRSFNLSAEEWLLAPRISSRRKDPTSALSRPEKGDLWRVPLWLLPRKDAFLHFGWILGIWW